MINLVTIRLARSSRKFVRQTERALAQGIQIPPGQMCDYNVVKEGVKFSKNPLKNIGHFVETCRQIAKEIAAFTEAGKTRIKGFVSLGSSNIDFK